jgi:hypothetical protein
MTQGWMQTHGYQDYPPYDAGHQCIAPSTGGGGISEAEQLRRCGVGTLDGGYLNKVPLPRAPRLQNTAALMTGNPDTCYLQVPRIPTWSNLTVGLGDLTVRLGAIRSTMLPLAPRWLM